MRAACGTLVRRMALRNHLDRFIHHPRTDVAVAALIVASILVLLVEFSEALDPGTAHVLALVSHLFTALFIVELGIRFWVAPSKRQFFRAYWLDIVAVIPFARSLRTFRLLRLLRLFRAGTLLSRSLAGFRMAFREGRSEVLVIVVTIFVIVTFSGFAIHFLEAHNPDFASLTHSLLWGIMSLIAGEPIGGDPSTLAGKLLLLAVMLGGLTVFAMFTGVITAVMVRRLRGSLEVKAMEISELAGHILICGWNRQGLLMLAELQADPELRRRAVVMVGEFGEALPFSSSGISEEHLYVVRGDPTRVDVLRQANATRATCAVLLADRLVDRLDQDRDARTILSALTLEKLNPGIYTIAQLLSREGEEHLRLAGVEEVVVSDELGASLVTTSIRNHGILSMVHTLVGSHDGNRLHKISPPAPLYGRPIGELAAHYKQRHDALVVAVEHCREGRREYIVNPPSDTVLAPGDKLIIIATCEPVETS